MNVAKLAKAWLVTVVAAGAILSCLGSVAGEPGDPSAVDAASGHAGHDASTRDVRVADATARDASVGDARDAGLLVREASSPLDVGARWPRRGSASLPGWAREADARRWPEVRRGVFGSDPSLDDLLEASAEERCSPRPPALGQYPSLESRARHRTWLTSTTWLALMGARSSVVTGAPSGRSSTILGSKQDDMTYAAYA